MRATIQRLVGLILLMAAFGACTPDRPSFETWMPVWSEMSAMVPTPETYAAASGHTLCNQLLVAARERRSDLLPAPDAALDEPVLAWLDAVRRLGFECPSGEDQDQQIRRQIRELRILADEVTAGAEESRTPASE
jgi:hypothetical protein